MKFHYLILGPEILSSPDLMMVFKGPGTCACPMHLSRILPSGEKAMSKDREPTQAFQEQSKGRLGTREETGLGTCKDSPAEKTTRARSVLRDFG